MAVATAQGRFLRIAPRKARLVADLIRNKPVGEAREILEFSVKKGGPILKKLLDSAAANAESEAAHGQSRIDTDEMIVTHVAVDGGPVMRRMRPASRGRPSMIRKRTSHVRLVIADKEGE